MEQQVESSGTAHIHKCIQYMLRVDTPTHTIPHVCLNLSGCLFFICFSSVSNEQEKRKSESSIGLSVLRISVVQDMR